MSTDEHLTNALRDFHKSEALENAAALRLLRYLRSPETSKSDALWALRWVQVGYDFENVCKKIQQAREEK